MYYLILGFTLLGVLLSASNQWRLSRSPRSQRLVMGLWLLLGGQILVFLLSLAAFSGLYDPRSFLPIVDRFILAASLVVVFWMWAFPKPTRLADALTLLVLFLLGVLLALSLFLWVRIWETTPFNDNWLGILWTVAGLILASFAAVFVLIKKPAEWVVGVIFFGINLAGYLWALFMGGSGDFSSAIRFIALATFPLLFVLPQRFLMPLEEKPKKPETPIVVPSRRRFGVDPGILDAVMQLISEKDRAHLCQAITRMVSQSMLADICFLMTVPDAHGDIVIQCAYDLIREKPISGVAFNENSAPILCAALKKGRSLRLPSSSLSPDLNTLTSLLELQKNGHLMMSPLISEQNGQPLAGLVVLSPYSNRNWSLEEQTYLEKMARGLGRIVTYLLTEPVDGVQSIRQAEAENTIAQLKADLQAANEMIAFVTQEREALFSQLQQAQQVPQSQEMDVQQAPEAEETLETSETESTWSQEVAREQIADLMLENQQLKETLMHYMEERRGNGLVEDNEPGAIHLERDALKQRLQDLESELETLHQLINRLEEEKTNSEKQLAVLASAQSEALSIIHSLQEENARLESRIQEQPETELHDEFTERASYAPGPFADTGAAAALNVDYSSLVEENEQLDRELRKALEQVARLQTVVGESRVRLFQLERQAFNSALAQERLQVIVDMTRELRQPMASITGYTDFLLSESVGILGTLQRKFLERIRVSTERLDEMVNDLLENAEAEIGKLSLSPLKAVRMNDVLDHAISQTSGFIMEKNITLQVDIPPDLPVVSGDADALNQIFYHLLRNAGDVTPVDGEISLRASVERFGERQDFIHIQVTDSGGGIPAEYLSQVFEPAQSQAEPHIPGLGASLVGLVVSKNLVDAHGGRIWVDSTPGRGATFSILLPVMSETEAGWG